MHRRLLLIGVVLLMAFSPASGGIEEPRFTRKPVATRNGDTVRIEFGVNRETDVAVYVETAKGEIVRHLVAGSPAGRDARVVHRRRITRT